MYPVWRQSRRMRCTVRMLMLVWYAISWVLSINESRQISPNWVRSHQVCTCCKLQLFFQNIYDFLISCNIVLSRLYDALYVLPFDARKIHGFRGDYIWIHLYFLSTPHPLSYFRTQHLTCQHIAKYFEDMTLVYSEGNVLHGSDHIHNCPSVMIIIYGL